MEITKIEKIEDYNLIFDKDENGRDIKLYNLKNCQFVIDKTFYPDVSIYSHTEGKIYNPINEVIKSLEKLSFKKNFNFQLGEEKTKITIPVFYFIYNTENYFHFIYDTLPYLITFDLIRKKIPNIKLLINYPNTHTKSIYNFVKELLNLLGITDNDITIVNENTIYDNVFVSSSYTHGHNSDLPPRKEIYNFFKSIVDSNLVKFKINTPKKIYISRRSWIHNDFSNIGTNYTLKRKMDNEDELVKLLSDKGFIEVFTEKLTTIEKLNLFYNADEIVGAIGGGLCNVLFSKPNTKLFTIVSPTFLDVNYRFKYSLDCVNTSYFYDTYHTETTEFKIGMRVESSENLIVGEIIKVDEDSLTIIYSDNIVAGWSNQIEFKKIELPKSECVKLDKGLNSAFCVNLYSISNFIV
jgi:hypothetical protein